MKQYLDQQGVEYLWNKIQQNFANLSSNGTIPAHQLPSYVDDVLECGSLSSFPETGEEGKIYVALDTNLTYRWGGSTYVEISPSIGLGETSSTAYPGSKGKQLATALQSEVSRATTAENDIRSTITAEQNRAQNSEQELSGLIEKNTNDITKVSNALDDATSEITTSLEAEKQSRIDADNAEKTERQSADTTLRTALNTHKADTSNPHKVTKAQVGLDKVDNTADADKVVASADKLTTSRKIWGQEFDGESDISGDITLDGSIISSDTRLVDLGLASGTLWMDRNVGASSPEDAGLYFAWGETQGYTASEVGAAKQFEWNDYKFGTSSSLTKYNSTDGLTALETTDDAVLQNVHKCSIPTKVQIEELLDRTTYEYTTQNDVNGILLTSMINGNSIFIPTAGVADHGSVRYWGSTGYLWTNSLKEDNVNYAYYLELTKSNPIFNSINRCRGFSVRGVATPEETTSTIALPSSSGTLALTSDVEAETARATAKEEELQAAIDSKQDSGNHAVLDSFEANNEHWLYFSSASNDTQITCESEDGKCATRIRGGVVNVKDGSCNLSISPNGVWITELSEKDLLGARENIYYVGSESDTTEYTAVAPLGSDNKIPAQYLDSSSSSPAYPYLFFSWGSGGSEYHYEEIAVKEGEIVKLIPTCNSSVSAYFYIYTTDQTYAERVNFISSYCAPVYLTGSPYTAHICGDQDTCAIFFKATLCDEIPSDTSSDMIFNPTASTTE